MDKEKDTPHHTVEGGYCPQCGQRITTAEIKRLLDLSRNYFAFRLNYWNWGNGPIMDEKGEVIGRIQCDKNSFRVQDIHKSPCCTMTKKLARRHFNILDEYQAIFGSIRSFHGDLYLCIFSPESSKEPCIVQKMTSDDPFFSCDLTHPSGKVLAQMHPTKWWPEIFSDTIFQFGDTYAINILEPSVDRRLLLGFAIVYEWDQKEEIPFRDPEYWLESFKLDS